MTQIAFTVDGVAVPAGSKKSFQHPSTYKILTLDSSGERGREWRHKVASEAAAAMGDDDPLAGAVELAIEFVIPRPQNHVTTTGAESAAARRRPYPTTRPDLTKLVRGVEDAITGICWRDDCQVVHTDAVKVYTKHGGRPRVHITITTL
jgi:Holliday junction resolvase RusA-like endonuclease